MDPSQIKVRAYAGYRGAERPLEFELGERTLTVLAILDRWYDPESDLFKVKASDGNIYILRHGAQGGWTLVSYRRV